MQSTILTSLYQDIHYYHDGKLADNKYRRPWTRASADSTVMNISVADIWKKCLFTEDFLEKKPVSNIAFHTPNEDVEIIPSSNPSSQISTQDYMLMKLDKGELTDRHRLQVDYVPVALKQEGLYIEEELVFTNNLTQSGKSLPSLQTLLSRLNVFQVQDPLLNFKGDSFMEEDILRECFTFKMSVTPQEKGMESSEDFCKVCLKDEEIPLFLVKFQFCEATNSKVDMEILTCLALKSLLQVTPEILEDENEYLRITNEKFNMTIIPEMIKSSEHYSTQEVYSSQNKDLSEFNNPISYNGELEVPLTPPCRKENMCMNSLYVHLKPEPVSPINKSDFITESTSNYLEGLMWQSEKYQNAMSSLFLIVPQNSVAVCQKFSVIELRTKLSIHENSMTTGSLEEDEWINLRENLTVPCVLEALSVNVNDEGRLANTDVEDYSKVTNFQLDEWLDDKSSFCDCNVKNFSIPHCIGTKDSCSPKKNETFSSLSLTPTSPQYSISIADNNVSTENYIKQTKLQNEIEKPVQIENHEVGKNNQIVSCKKVSISANSRLRNKKSVLPEQPRKCKDDFDLLSNFIMLRSKQVISQRKEGNDMDIQEEVFDAEDEQPSNESHKSPGVPGMTIPMENQSKDNHTLAFLKIKTSERQSQAYHILEAAAAPVLKELIKLDMQNWRFATLNSDNSRFFLKQQEKVISDTLKQGSKDAKYILVFRHAAILHLLVTVRDLLLTCNLNTALEYLSKAKDNYKDFQDYDLDIIWKQLKIVEIVVQEQKVSPKMTELQHQIAKWVQNNANDQNKVVIVIRMDFDEETEVLINTINTVQGLKAIYLSSKKRGMLLESKHIINSLDIYSCIVIHNQHIGPDFPWTNFSLVIEYNYNENSCWIDLCKKMNISYLIFQTAPPEAIETEEFLPDNLGYDLLKLSIPYVFLTSEGLLNTPEILQLLESKYNITLIERNCCEALNYFGGTEHYVVMTIDECTAIVMQNMEELNYENSSDNIVLRLMALSLQYVSCWIILYSRERLNSKYSLTGKTLHHLALIYAALISFAQKSEDFEVKMALTPGVEETALLVRQIADHILLASKQHPQEWLNKSWLSVLPLEAEKCLLTFPCMNPLVAQVMLKKNSSLEWLLGASFAELQELLPEVPEKVLKNFSDITSLYNLKPLIRPGTQKESISLQGNINSAICSCSQLPFPEALFSRLQGHSSCTEYSECFLEEWNKNCSQNGSCGCLKSTGEFNLVVPSISYEGDTCPFQENVGVERQLYLPFLKKVETETRINASHLTLNIGEPSHVNNETTMPHLHCNQDISSYIENCPLNRMTVSKVDTGKQLDISEFLKKPIYHDAKNEHLGKIQPLVQQLNSFHDFKHSSHVISSRKNVLFQENSGSVLEIGRKASSSPALQSEERFWGNPPFIQAMDSSPYDSREGKAIASPDRFMNLGIQFTGDYTRGKGHNSLSGEQRQQDVSGLEFMQLPQLKKRRLTFEKDPRRHDGQTRLKFF
ncbi:protein shortage in chiasmata 1 ortholog isoform X2 [Pantherophis guttatus]|uniref:Protein shortage in chiasmata 1 ortholog isoform X2 n=1 Tax=Pantherophis guttatus TaxID=94885 RepID=A0A6P9BEP9_PANGU|nr:protein shortage in chiasmata 1 ortholog isoform X2 [Pantherophis guttatus]XP_034266477.1 protein shortage in chiasmata 1 ortholog isoform X2 [Pantherophis guttatus]